jgi:thiol:disulfide interchange protein DsbD
LLKDSAVLSSDEFEQLVKEKNIYLFKADWTNENAEVTQALAQYGRNSIPLYVYYDNESENAKILPQLLTKAIVKEYMQ